MTVVAEIVATWRAPRAAMTRRLAQGPNEARSLAVLMAGSFLVWVAQWPRLRRDVELWADGPDFVQLAGTALVLWVMLVPLVLYLVAGLTHVASRAMGGRGAGWQARAVLFWAWLAAAPAALAAGAAGGLFGPGVVADLLGLLWLGALVAFWALGQRSASTGIVGA